MQSRPKLVDLSAPSPSVSTPAAAAPTTWATRTAAPPSRPAPGASAPVRKDSDFDIAKAYLLAVWTSLLKSNRSYARAVHAIDMRLTTAKTASIPVAWEETAPSLPRGWSSSVERGGKGLTVLKVASPVDRDVIHLTIPPDTSGGEGPHLTYTVGIDTKRINVPSKAGRRTRRSLPKQKRTRRVVRRLVRA